MNGYDQAQFVGNLHNTSEHVVISVNCLLPRDGKQALNPLLLINLVTS